MYASACLLPLAAMAQEKSLGVVTVTSGQPTSLPTQIHTTMEGITKEQVIRTIRPTIMWNQTMMQRGQIDIAVPASKN